MYFKLFYLFQFGLVSFIIIHPRMLFNFVLSSFSVEPVVRADFSDHGQLLPDGAVDPGRQPSRVGPDDTKQFGDVARRITPVHQVQVIRSLFRF